MSLNLTDEQLNVLILFTLKSAVTPIPQSSLGEILGICDINYFNIGPVLDDVIEKQFVLRHRTDDGIFLSLTDKGKEISEILRTQLPVALRQKIVLQTAIEIQRLKQALAVETKINQKLNNGNVEYSVKLVLKDDGSEIINLSMYCPTEHQAQMMEQSFKENANDIYKKILEIFIKR